VRSYPIRRLGILRLSAIGDVVHAMPLAMGLRRAFPHARITWVVEAKAAPLLTGHPAVDDVLLFPRRGGAWAWARFLGRLWDRRFDLTVDPQGNWKSGLVGILSGANVRSGLNARDCKEWGNALFTNRQARRARGLHGVDRAWAAGEAIGVEPGPDEWGLASTEREKEAWRERCRAAGADPDGPLLAVHLTDPGGARSWFPDYWALTARRAAREGLQVILNGGADRRELASKISAEGIHDLTGKDDLRGLLAQFECMAAREGNLLLSPDSGPVHMAVAVGLSVLCLSGPQDPGRTGPREGGVSMTAWEGLPCAPCLERECVREPPDRACMREIKPDAVLERIREMSTGASTP
jgi:ADP-heptose:LPS heptosyltransferase